MATTLSNKGEIIEKDVELLLTKADFIIEKTIRKINFEIILMYWRLGKMIYDYKKENNSKYGDAVVELFSENLSLKHGRGFGLTNIKSCLNFYIVFKKSPTSDEFENVTWSHCREIIHLGNSEIILFYLKDINNKKLTIDQLRKNLKSKSYERTIGNQREGKIINKIEKTLRDPLLLNFKNKRRTEKDLEDMIIQNIFDFMKEIGNSVMLYGRQYKININGLTHKVDLVFFDNEINSYILVDLKINKVTNKDIFQMQMYIDYFNKHMKKDKFNNTVGIILCETKDARVLTDDDIYQVKYLNEIPKDKELLKIINDNKIILLKTENLRLDK
ncbi:MAG: PDDEXK nuclease domain-containing protein [Oscillospiraceae bacterium]|nr:PDDEXK nuclease domain-containing protein [Oscillospiraceae bacterium]